MKVLRACSSGFCFGVSLALKSLDSAINSRHNVEKAEYDGKRLITLGPIIHNPLVMDDYKKKGVLCADSSTVIHKNDIVVVRAHGIPQEEEHSLLASGASIIDATCPKVKKAQLAIAEESAKGKVLLLFGEKEHPEVKGLISYAKHNAIVFSQLIELESEIFSDEVVYFLAAQTTQDREAFEDIALYLKKRLECSLTVLNTICDATKKRQDEVIHLSKEVEAFVIVGGHNSGNTRRLADVARAQGLLAFHVEQSSELQAKAFTGITSVGLTAGASTPDEHITNVYNFLISLP